MAGIANSNHHARFTNTETYRHWPVATSSTAYMAKQKAIFAASRTASVPPGMHAVSPACTHGPAASIAAATPSCTENSDAKSRAGLPNAFPRYQNVATGFTQYAAETSAASTSKLPDATPAQMAASVTAVFTTADLNMSLVSPRLWKTDPVSEVTIWNITLTDSARKSGAAPSHCPPYITTTSSSAHATQHALTRIQRQ